MATLRKRKGKWQAQVRRQRPASLSRTFICMPMLLRVHTPLNQEWAEGRRWLTPARAPGRTTGETQTAGVTAMILRLVSVLEPALLRRLMGPRRTRRSMLGIAGGLAALPLSTRAQAPRRPFRLGVMTRARDLNSGSSGLVLQELQRLGFVEGRDLTVELKAADGDVQLYPRFARELVESGVDAILAGGGETAARAAIQATRTIPIVIFVDDAISAGFVPSLANPGANVTGVSLLASELDGKRQALLGEALPEGASVAALGDLTRSAAILPSLEAAAAIRHQRLVFAQGTSVESVTAAMMDAQAKGALGLNVLASSILFGHSRLIIERSFSLKLATIFQWPELAQQEGALMAYGPPFPSIVRQLAAVIARLMDGAGPPNLPVQQPTQIELVINLKTARALGMAMPPSLLVRANEVIE